MRVFTNDQLLEIVRMSDQEGRKSRYIAEIFGCGKTTIGDFLRKETYTDFWESKKPTVSGSIHEPDKKRKRLAGNKFVFTSAQNNTYVHDNFLKSLEGYCIDNDARLIVGTFHYNKNAYQKHDEEDDKCWFDPKIRDYILDEDVNIADDLVWCGELDIIPTAVNPMVGFHSYTKQSCGIIPHVKVQLESVPTPKYLATKILYTTGAITQRNYIQRKAGQIASFHHVFGALVVEIDEDGDWFARQLSAESDTGEFYDLDRKYTPYGSESLDHIEAINWGDIHAAKLDKLVAEVSWGSEDSILNVLKPKKQLVHDVFDMKYRNHHNIKDSYFRYQMFIEGTESVKDEVKLTASEIEGMMRVFSDVVIIQSNHDLALKKWLSEQDYRTDPVNAEFFLEMQLASYKAIKDGSEFAVFEHACKTINEKLIDVRFLGEDESFIVAGIECGQHSANGNNGARGSIRAFQVQGRKFNIGHSHSAAIKDNVFCAGISGLLDQNYNVGGSSWSHSHIGTYPNGKRFIITIKNGKWRA